MEDMTLEAILRHQNEEHAAEIARLTAALAEAEARCAAVLAEGARRMDQGFSYNAGNAIRALIPEIATAALDQIKAEAEARGYARAVEDAAIICEALNDKRLSGASGDFIATLASQRIRALAQKESGE